MIALRPMALLALLGAPLQCPSRASPAMTREDRPDDALWSLSERFGHDGNEAARRATLRYLIERYPTSRFSDRAVLALDGSVPVDAAQ